MRILFMGTPDFAVPSLQALIQEGYDVVAVVSQPDRPKGRKRELAATPVKAAAMEHGLPVLQPERIKAADALEQLRAYEPDLIVTAAYGQILPKALLELPKLGCINVHASLLPKYRGGAPIQWAIINGEQESGVTIMYMAEGLDTGDMISRVVVPIEMEDDAGSLFTKLSLAGAKLLLETLPSIAEGRVQAVAQQHELSTYAPNITREHERIDWSKPALAVWNQIRGLCPWPVAFTYLNGEVLKVWRANPPSDTTSSHHLPGTLIHTDRGVLSVACGAGSIELTEVQPAGKRSMKVEEWLRGTSLPKGLVLGGPNIE